MAAISDRQSPPSARAVAISRTTFDGSCRARGGRHGDRASARLRSRPQVRIVSRSTRAPDEEISDSRPGSMTTLATRLRFTAVGPPCTVELDLRQAKNPPSERHFHAVHAAIPSDHVKYPG